MQVSSKNERLCESNKLTADAAELLSFPISVVYESLYEDRNTSLGFEKYKMLSSYNRVKQSHYNNQT